MKKVVLPTLIIATILSLFIFSGCYYDKGDILYPNSCDTTAYKFSADIKPIFVANCDNCHGVGGPNLPELGKYALIKDYIDKNPGLMEDAINGANGISLMTKNSQKIPDCSINKIQNWINAGAPNN